MKRDDVYKLIDDERDYQSKKWNEETTQSKGFHSPAEWLVYIQDYLSEAVHVASRNPDPLATDLVMCNIRKIASMSVAAMEQNETMSREEETQNKKP